MGLFSRRRAPIPASAVPNADWSLLESIRSEWPNQDFDGAADLASWRQGMDLYDARDDYASLIEAGGLMCRALRHHLYGRGLLVGPDIPDTTHRVLFASCCAPPDGRSFPQPVQAQVRLGLAIVKKHGWQPAEHGGNDAMAKYLLHVWALLTVAVAPSPDHPLGGDLKHFFSANPYDIPLEDPPPPDSAPSSQVGTRLSESELAEIEDTIQAAEAGDQAAAAKVRAMRAMYQGDAVGALREYEVAAELGDLDAMFEAGNRDQELGLDSKARQWWEAAADRGHGESAVNVGIAVYQEQGREASQPWLERAAAAGTYEAYGALTQIADECGDAEAEFHWSRLGAEHHHPFCQMRYGQLLMQRDEGNTTVIRTECLPLFEQAAESGQDGALFLAGIAHCVLGDVSTGRLWLKRAEASGDSSATRVLREHGLE